MAPPNPDRQIHRACGDIRVSLSNALEVLSATTIPSAGHHDVFRAVSDLGQLQHHVAMALHATNMLDQMVGTSAEHRRPWAYYRARIGKKLSSGVGAPLNGCNATRFDSPRVDVADRGGPPAGRTRAETAKAS